MLKGKERIFSRGLRPKYVFQLKGWVYAGFPSNAINASPFTIGNQLFRWTSSSQLCRIFDAAGTFLFKAERIKYADVPTVISAAVTANYSTYTVMKRAAKLTLPDGSVQYKVFMELSGVRKSVTFNADGTVACEK